jgi:hypothetical protein
LMGFYMFVLGTGIGLVMQILVTAVQNSVNHEDVGAATAGANFFRSIGGSFGTAVFGALFANEIPHRLSAGLKGTIYAKSKFSVSQLTPQKLKSLPEGLFKVVIHALAGSIQVIYIWAVPVGVLAVVLSLTLPELKLRESLHPIADEVPMSNVDPLL